MMNASLFPNFRADSSRMSFSVSMSPSPLARERPQRLASPLTDRWIVREQDRLHIKLREPCDRAPSQVHVVGEEVVRKGHLAAHALQQITHDEQPTCRRIQTDAPRCVTWGMQDPEPAQHG